jgi:dTDP-glucose pyrophosphorylase
MNNINIVIPAAGIGSRFLEYGFKETKFLLPIDKKLKTMINEAINTLVMNSNNELKFTFIFILRITDKNKDRKLEEYLKNICIQKKYDVFIKWIDYVTEGPASSAYLVKDLINNYEPLIISNSDQILDWNFSDFYNKCMLYDGCVLTYKPSYKFNIGDKDKHSFVKFDDNGIPIEFVEKTAISKEALVGVHYYKTGILFLSSYEYIYNKNMRAPNGEFYLSYTYQGLINMGYKVGTYNLPNNNYFYPVGEPIDYFNYYNKICPILKINLNEENKNIIENTLREYNNYFSINFSDKNEKININGKVFVLINGKTNINKSIFILNNIDIIFLEKSSYILFNLNTEIENKIIDRKDYLRGWLIGDFEPSIERNKNIELAYLFHEMNSIWDYHYHKEAIEINFLLKGSMIINNVKYNKNSLFIIDKNIVSCPLFLEDCDILCIKIPSKPKDKYIV